MFQFPRCPLRDRSQSARPCAGRVAPFGHPRITGCQRLPGAFRRVAASFVGRQRQGIHHAPIMRSPDLCCPSRSCRGDGSRPARASGTCRAWPDPGPMSRPLSCGTDGDGFVMCVCSARGRPLTSPTPTPLPGRWQSLGRVSPRGGHTCSRGRRTRRVPRGALSRYWVERTPPAEGFPPPGGIPPPTRRVSPP